MIRTRIGEAAPSISFTLITRIALFGIVWLSMRALPRLPYYPAQLPDSFLPELPSLDGWARWDSAHYVAIAEFGYGQANPSQGEGLGFLPVFPLMMRYVVELSPADPSSGAYAVAGIILANVFLVTAVILLGLLASAEGLGSSRTTATALMVLMPFAFFLSAAYSESLFVTICLASLLLAARGRWLGAGLVGSLATATRIAGFALVPALLFGAWRDGKRGLELLTAGFLPASGFLIWTAYTAWKWDNPTAYFDAQSLWGGWSEHVRLYAELFVRTPRQAISGDSRHLIIMLNVAVALVFLAILPAVWKTTSPVVAMFTVVIVVAHVAATWVSLGRYLLPAIGVYLAGGQMLTSGKWSGWPRDAILTSLAILLAALAMLFAHGFWVV